MSLTERKTFAEIVKNVRKRVSIDRLVEMCDEAGFWPDDFEERALLTAKKVLVRKHARETHYDDKGREIELLSIIETNPRTGRKNRVYKQLTFFEKDDFVDAIGDRVRRHKRDFAEIERLFKLAVEKYGENVQQLMPFLAADDEGNITII